jgi:UPF0716 protein FxsA
MSLLGRLFLLFVGVPLLELFILVQVGQLVGVWPTVGLVVLTGVTGGALARLEGLRTLWKVRGELSKGHLPGSALLDGLAILLGGVLLLTPGILTDLVGFSFLLPPTRKILLGRIRRGLENRLKSGAIRVTHVTGFTADVFGAPAAGEQRSEGPQTSSGEIVIEAEDSRES